MSLKSTGFILAIALGVGPFAKAAPKGQHVLPAQPLSTTGSTFIPAPRGFGSVEAALSQFDYALAMHDVGMLQVAGVNTASAKLWDKFFSENPLATVTDDCPVSELFVSEDAATWTCTETVTIISAGRPRAFYHVIRFRFGRTRGIWKVADRW